MTVIVDVHPATTGDSICHLAADDEKHVAVDKSGALWIKHGKHVEIFAAGHWSGATIRGEQ